MTRDGLSSRMLTLIRWYGGDSYPRRIRTGSLTVLDYAEAMIASRAPKPAASHGRSRRDGTRP